MLDKLKKAALALVGLLITAAIAIGYAMNRRGVKAQATLATNREADAGAAERRKMNAGQLADLKEQIAKEQMATGHARTDAEVEAELRARGHIK